MPPFALQKTAYCNAKGGLSQCERPPFGAHPQFVWMVGKNIYRLLPSANQAVGNMFRRICNPPKFTIRICNPIKPRIYKNMYIYERIANPQLRTAGLQIRRNKLPKRRPFIAWKAAFRIPVCRLLHCKRRPFATHWRPRRYAVENQSHSKQIATKPCFIAVKGVSLP